MNQLKGFKRARFDRMKGTFTENAKYCSKSAALTHFGEPFVGQGGRTDRNEIFAMLKDGADDMQLMEADFTKYCRFRNGIADFRSLKAPKRVDPLEVYLFHGPPGTGKTEFARSQLGEDHYRIPLSDSFWLTPAACDKKFILVDEFRANMKLPNLLQLLDKYPIEVQKKGAFSWWCPDAIIITTNKSIHDWYDYKSRDMEKEALFRRFDGAYRFEKNLDRVPRPFPIDINDPVDFDYPWVPKELRPDPNIPVARFQQGHREVDEGMIIQ